MSTAADLCDECLRRTDLLAALAGQLDIEWRRRSAPAGVLSLPEDALLALDPTGAAAVRRAAFRPGAARDRIAGAGLQAVCRCSSRFPERLRELPDPPAVLHIAGDPSALADATAVALVGARRGSPYGLEVARGLGYALSAAGTTVVSGLALGVDAAAHVGALGAGGRVVAVLAGGADRPYPAQNRALRRRVAERGCVVSELPPGVGPHRWAFVARNRIIAGLAAMTVVVEATERSGSLTTADFAAEVGRAVGAVPGQVTSRFAAGANALLAAGAVVVRDAGDILDVVVGPTAGEAAAAAGPAASDATAVVATAAGPAGATATAPVSRAAGPAAAGPRRTSPATASSAAPAVPLEPQLRRLLRAIERGHGTPAELAGDAAAFGQVLHDLTELELRGLVRRDFGGRYVRALGHR